MPGKTSSAILMIVLFLAGLGIGYGVNVFVPLAPAPETKGLTGKIQIGALEDRSGALTTYGEDIKTAYEIAEEDVNAFLKKMGAEWTIELLHEDTESTPDVALEKFESLVGKGVKIILGPMMSPACAQVKEYAQSNDVLYISPSSTAIELKIPGDNLFRFCAIDDLQGPAIASAVYSSGITRLVSVYVDNDWGAGLDESAADKFESLGGIVVEHIPFAPETIEFAPIVEKINSAVQKALDSGVPLEKIGVFAVTYRQILTIFTVASKYPNLSKVRWFGTDGTVMIPELADFKEHPTETRFALDTKFTSTMFKIPMTRAYKHVHDETVKRLGREPTIYAYDAYDSVWVVALSLAVVGEYDAMKVKEILPKIADIYIGASGDIFLDENGDLAIADYSLWRPVETDGSVEWKEVGIYRASADKIEWMKGYGP